MKLIISFCAPAVMESMATTAPTPKIMPSMVSRLRSLCANKLAIPINNSGPTLESPILFPPSHAAHGITAAPGFLLAVLLFIGGGVGHGHDLARLHAARNHHHGFALFDELHRARLEPTVLGTHVDQKLAVL